MLFAYLSALQLIITPSTNNPVDAIALLRSGNTYCRQEAEDTIVYVGSTDALMDCVKSSSQETTRLIVTSGGGDVIAAVNAANYISERGFSVTIRGACLSSCGNYIVPAARFVSIEPNSVIGLHGAPNDDQHFISQIEDEIERQQLQAYPHVTPEVIEDGRMFARKLAEDTIQAHLAFQIRFSVSDDWYDLDWVTSNNVALGRSGFAIVDEDFFRLNLPKLPLREDWWPVDCYDRTRIQSILSGAQIYFRSANDNMAIH